MPTNRRSAAANEPDLDGPDVFISIEHKDVSPPDGEPAPRVTREAFEVVYKDKGWSEIKDSASLEAVPSGGVVTDVSSS
jgi:hypothetical protein